MQSSTPAVNNNVIKPLTTSNKMSMIVVLAIFVVLGGLAVGYFLSVKKTTSSALTSNTTTSSNKEAGKDSSTFKDTATGTLQTGGIKGEGTYHLDRPGGETQTVYLTSTVIDMSPFVGKKVQVWGQTQSSKYAPWFMDVGKIKVVD